MNMTNLREQLRAADPVSRSELDRLASAPVFDELCRTITAGGRGDAQLVGPDVGPSAPSMNGRRSRGVRLGLGIATAGVVAVVLLVAFVVSPGSPAPVRGHGGVATAAPAWRLVGNVSPSWTIQPGSGLELAFALTCPAAGTCYATDIRGASSERDQGDRSLLLLAGGAGVDSIEVTTDGGDTWQRRVLPVALSNATRLVCMNTDTCALLGFDGSGHATFVETTDGGHSWTTSPGPGGLTSATGVTALSCATAASCVAVASDPAGQTGAAAAYATRDGGNSWTESDLPPDFVPSALQCTSRSGCVTVGFRQAPNGSETSPTAVALFTSDAGATWTSSSLPPTAAALTGLACVGSDCIASFLAKTHSANSTIHPASTVLVSADAGTSWRPTGSAPDAFITGLSCPAGSHCWASGIGIPSPSQSGQRAPVLYSGGIISSTTDGGAEWRDALLPAGTRAVADISCPAVTSCYALALHEQPAPATGNGRPPATQPSRPVPVVLLAYGN
jgi:photosystem II stability/assembly factor-like uncharacterized protein